MVAALNYTKTGQSLFLFFLFFQLLPCFSQTINTVTGNGTQAYSGDGGSAILASLSFPEGIALDAAGNLIIADYYNNCVRRVDATGVITTLVSGLGAPSDVKVDAFGNLFIVEQK